MALHLVFELCRTFRRRASRKRCNNTAASVRNTGLATCYGLDGPGSNPGGGEIFRARPDRPWGPPNLLYSGYPVCFPGVKQQERGVSHPPPSRAEVKQRVELYLYSPSGLSWPFLWLILLFLPVGNSLFCALCVSD